MEGNQHHRVSAQLIHRSNRDPWHFLHGFHQYLGERLGLEIRPTEFKRAIHLADQEKHWISQVHEIVWEPAPFWIETARGKFDFTAKWWAHERC